jgi:uncharacterized protein (TIGR03435 family)
MIPRMLLLVFPVMAAEAVWAQEAGGPKPFFEVASVKPSTGNGISIRLGAGGRFTAINCTLSQLIALAYDVRGDELSGGPSWVSSEVWNIEAKADQESLGSRKWPDLWPDPSRADDPVTPMVQALLEERFHLKLLHQSREVSTYDLIVTKGGPKIKGTAGADSLGIGRVQRGVLTYSRVGYLAANGVPMARLVKALSETAMLGRAVVDKTGLTGLYDFELQWTPERGVVPAAAIPDVATKPSLSTALEEQLGLKVQSAKGARDFLVIDGIERPSAN